jgi:hypothetical protein
MRTKFTLSALFLLIVCNTSAQFTLPDMVFEPVTPITVYLTPIVEGVYDEPREFNNFLKRDQPAYVHTTPPMHYKDNVWQQSINAEKTPVLNQLLNFNGIGNTNVSPPDPSGEAGQDYYIQAVNGASGARFRIFDKATGNPVGAAANFSTLGTLGSGYGDPIVIYDAMADRWVLSEFSANGNKMNFYVSQTSAANGAYWGYQFTTPNFPDYPKMSVWPTGYFFTSNEGAPPLYALDREKMLLGQPATMQRFTVPAMAGFGFQALTPVDFDGTNLPPAGAPAYFARHRDDEAHNPGNNNTANDFIEIYSLNVNFTTPTASTLSAVLKIPVSEFDSDLCGLTSFSCITQQGSNTKLDPLREVLMYKVQYRNFGSHETMLMCLTTDVNGNNRAGIRWIELRKSGAANWSLYQEGTFAPNDNLSRWMGSIAMDKFGNIALAYSIAGSSKYPSLRYTGRSDCDPLGQMTLPEQEFAAGTAAANNNRWGDYHHMSVDPSDDRTFWFTGMFSPAANWSTKIVSFQFEQAALDGKAAGLITPTCGSSNNQVGLVFTNNGTSVINDITYTWVANGGSINNGTYNGPLNPGQSDTVFVNPTLVGGSNDVTFTIVNVNGSADLEVCNNTFSLSFDPNASTLTASAAITAQISCNNGNNGQITATSSGATGAVTYSINGGTPQSSNIFTGLNAGQYTITVTDANGCTASTQTITINNPSAITANATVTNETASVGNNGIINVSASGGSPTYQYSKDGTNYQLSNQFSGLAAGTYTIYIKDSKGCIKTIEVTVGKVNDLGIEMPLWLSSVSLFPVPAGSELNLQINNLKGENSLIINITDESGKILMTKQVKNLTDSITQKFEIQNMAAGVYFVNVKNENNISTTLKFIKK